MVTLQTMIELVNARKNKVLLFAQAALPEHQFVAFKKLFLDEFGTKGLESDMLKAFASAFKNGEIFRGNGQEDLMQERRCHHD